MSSRNCVSHQKDARDYITKDLQNQRFSEEIFNNIFCYNMGRQSTKSNIMQKISWNDFSQVELRVGKIIEVNDFPEAHRPAYQLRIDFGDKIGVRKSSAQITAHYEKADLIGRLVVAVVNLPPKQIGSMMSECLVTGFHGVDHAVHLCVPDGDVPLGAKLC